MQYLRFLIADLTASGACTVRCWKPV